MQVGVSPILFYDPIERVVATLHPNHTYEKVVFDPWRQVTWDVNDTVLGDPRTDADIRGYTAGYFASLPAALLPPGRPGTHSDKTARLGRWSNPPPARPRLTPTRLRPPTSTRSVVPS